MPMRSRKMCWQPIAQKLFVSHKVKDTFFSTPRNLPCALEFFAMWDFYESPALTN